MRRIVLASSLFFVAIYANAVSLTRGPYLGRPDDVSVAVIWRTDVAADSRVDYGAVEESTWKTTRSSDLTKDHKVRIDGLSPGGVYRYQAYSDDVPLGPESEFRAPRDASHSEFIFAVIGDTNAREGSELHFAFFSTA